MSTSTIVRPEFQLIVAGLDFISASGILVKVGTVYGRLYFSEACEVTGSFKGTIIKDSWQSGAPYSANRKCRAIEFLATPEVYSTLYKSCGKSNLPSNRINTFKLLEKCLAAPAAVRPIIRDEWDMSISVVKLFPGITSGNNFDDWAEVAPAIFASDWTTEELWACTVKQLKVIAKKLGFKADGTKAEIIAKIQSH